MMNPESADRDSSLDRSPGAVSPAPTSAARAGGNDGSDRDMASQVVQGSAIPTFVIDRDHCITHWNRALEVFSGVAASAVLGTNRQWMAFYPSERPCMADLVLDNTLADDVVGRYYGDHWRRSAVIAGAYEAEGFFPKIGKQGSWMFFTAAPIKDAAACVVGAIETLQDITERKLAELELLQYKLHLEDLVQQRTEQLTRANDELKQSNRQLAQAQHQLLQSEKMASIGQLAAGVAHEINNPIGFINANLGSLESYCAALLQVIDACDAGGNGPPRVAEMKQQVDFDYLRGDLSQLLTESKEGLLRVKKIVQDLKDFSHAGAAEWQFADLHQGIDSTLNIVNHEIRYKARVTKEYGTLPQIECLPLELNQVFMALLLNAAQAIETRGEISIRSGVAGTEVWVEIADNGAGIAAENLSNIFNPFFTTKPVGKGTGLGLSVSYAIVRQHRGRIEVDSTPGKGTAVRVWLPLRRQQE